MVEVARLETLPDQIAQLETNIRDLTEEVSAPDFYRQDHKLTQGRLDRLAALERELEASIERWSELESLATGAGSGSS